MSFVLTAQFVLVNVVIAVLMKHLEESNKEAKEEAELEAELELEMKTLSPQAPSPLGSPFLWPGVEGPDSPGSPKPGAPHATPHTGTASHFSLEHPMVSRDPRSASRELEQRWVVWVLSGLLVGGVQGAGSKQTLGLLLNHLTLLPRCGEVSRPLAVPRDGCPHLQRGATPASHWRTCWLICPGASSLAGTSLRGF